MQLIHHRVILACEVQIRSGTKENLASLLQPLGGDLEMLNCRQLAAGFTNLRPILALVPSDPLCQICDGSTDTKSIGFLVASDPLCQICDGSTDTKSIFLVGF